MTILDDTQSSESQNFFVYKTLLIRWQCQFLSGKKRSRSEWDYNPIRLTRQKRGYCCFELGHYGDVGPDSIFFFFVKTTNHLAPKISTVFFFFFFF